MKTQMQLNQSRYIINHVVREPKRSQSLACDLGADNLVVVEADTTARLKTTSARLAYIVEQSR
jgi:hypothetical protein